MKIHAIKTALFTKKDSLTEFVLKYVPTLEDGDILIITSKIVAISQGRMGSIKDKKKIILSESKKAIETPWALLTLTNDGWGINAGVDESNADKTVILLPEDPFKTATALHQKLKKSYAIKNLGIIITDTRSVPLRRGTVGRAIAFAGFKPLKSYIGKKDLFGRKSRVTESNHADALAGAAVCVMGEGSERTPLAVIQHAPVIFSSKKLTRNEQSLYLIPEQDIFSKVFIAEEDELHARTKKK